MNESRLEEKFGWFEVELLTSESDVFFIVCRLRQVTRNHSEVVRDVKFLPYLPCFSQECY